MIKPPLVTFCSILGLFTMGSAFAGSVGSTTPNSVQGVAEREIVRRQDSMNRAHDAMVNGDKAMRQKDYDLAVQHYRAAVNFLPECPSTHKLRGEAVDSFCEASVLLAKQRISEGRFADAETIAKAVLDPQFDPHCGDALTLLSHLKEPDYYNKTVTPKFRANVDQVNQWMVDARGFYATGRYDMAFKRYEQILNVDPYNVAAQKGKEEVDRSRENYGIAAYDETRARMIARVTKGWEMPIRKYGSGPNSFIDQGPQSPNNTAAITAKLSRIIIPKVEFRDATVREAIDFLKEKSRMLDTESEPTRKGVNIVLQLDNPGGPAPAPAPATSMAPAADASAIPGLDSAPAPATPTAAAPAMLTPAINPNEARVTLSLNNVPLMEVLRYIVQVTGLKIKIDPYAVAIVPVTTITEQLITKEYKVAPGFLANSPSSGGGASTSPSASPASISSSSSKIGTRQGAKEYLEAQGVQFPQGASANFMPSSSKLIVRNTQDNLDLIETIVEAGNDSVPKQVEIESKFIEISQNNLKELSFDWLLGQFNLGGSKRLFSSGGTSGDGNSINSANFPYVAPDGSIVGTNPLTAGNRTGSGSGGAISANAIDALLFPAAAGGTSAAPGIMSIAGVFTDPQFQVVIRALNQKKGVDLLSAPRVTTKSGQRASIEIIREFRYPTEFNPPQIPQTVQASSSINLSGGGGGGQASIPITPTTPTAFETRNTGVSLEVEPVVGPDGSTIDLNLVPSVVEFEGFINYGSPILSPGSPSVLDAVTGLFTAATPQSVVTPNVINQPIFSMRKITTSVSIWDGQTVVLGGLIREDVQKVEDKVPLLGDLPLVGRAFRSSVDQHLKRNLMVFVTARLINPAGEPINQEEEKEETVESLVQGALPEPALPK